LLLTDVRRPDGTIASELGGAPTDADEPAPDAYPLTVNLAKDRAAFLADGELVARLEEEERTYLARRLITEGAPGTVRPLERAPRLSRLLQRVAERNTEASWTRLSVELRGRIHPFLVIATRADGELKPQTEAWQGNGTAVRAFPDLRSLALAAQLLGVSLEALDVTLMTPPELFRWATKAGAIVVMTTFDKPHAPADVAFDAASLEELAQDAPLSPPAELPARPRVST
jgi:hypothetical protein